MTLTPDVSGPWILGLTVAGQGDLYIDGQLVVENSIAQEADVSFVSFLLDSAEIVQHGHS